MIMEVIEADGYYLPPEFREQVKTFRTEVYQDGDATVRLKIPSVTGAMVEVLADHLKEEREKYLSHQPIERIVDVLDQASRKWLDRSYPYRELVLKTIPESLIPGRLSILSRTGWVLPGLRSRAHRLLLLRKHPRVATPVVHEVRPGEGSMLGQGCRRGTHVCPPLPEDY